MFSDCLCFHFAVLTGTEIGTSYYVSLPRSEDDITLTVTTFSEAQVTITSTVSYTGQTIASVTTRRGLGAAEIVIPDFVSQLLPGTSSSLVNPAILEMTASAPVLIRANLAGSDTCSSFKVPPREYWRSVYYVLTPTIPLGSTARAEVLITAETRNTWVDLIGPSHNPDASYQFDGSEFSSKTRLNFNILAQDGSRQSKLVYSERDLSGMYIQTEGSTQIMLLAGTTRVNQGGSSVRSDTTYTAVIPTDSWGNLYWVPSIPEATNGYTLKILSNTDLVVTNSALNTIHILSPGVPLEILMDANQATQLSANFGFMVIQVDSFPNVMDKLEN